MELSIENLHKHYRGGTRALDGLTLTITPGVLGLLGPNGAGKSTLMRIVATVARPTAGRVLWEGVDASEHPEAVRRVLGYLPQDFGVYPNLNAVEFLGYLAAAKGLDGAAARRRIEELLVLVNLADVRKRPLGGYSGGMRQRIGIAQALLNDPRLLIVDEPTAGLDPEERVRFRNLLAELSGERVVILSTHVVSDVEAVAADLAFIAGGRLLAHGAPEEILREVRGKVFRLAMSSRELEARRAGLRIVGTVRRADAVEVRVVADVPPPGSEAVEPTLEDAYLYTVSRRRAAVAA